MPDLQVSVSVFMPLPQKICPPSALLYSVIFCHFFDGVLTVFSVFLGLLCLKQTMMPMIWWVLGEKKHSVCFAAPFSSRIKVEQEKSCSKAELSKQKWSGLVLYTAVSTYTLGPDLLAMKVCIICITYIYIILVFASSMWRVWCLVWQWSFIVLLADQHHYHKRSCLAGASMCFWTQAVGYLQQVAQNTVSADTQMATLFFTSTRGTFTSKNLHRLV